MGFNSINQLNIYKRGFAMNRCIMIAVFTIVVTSSSKIKAQELVPAIPSAPTGLKCTGLEKSGCTLSWNAVSDPGVKYIIYRETWREAGDDRADTVTLTTFRDTTIIADKTYYYTVTAFNTAGESIPSDIISVQTDPPSGIIHGLKLKSVDTTSCTIDWYNGIDLELIGVFGVKYAIIRDGNIIDTVSATEYRDTTLTINRHYFYHISSFNVFGSSRDRTGPLLVSTFPAEPLPASPNGFAVWSEGIGCHNCSSHDRNRKASCVHF
jgi:hypothetical protein